MTVHRLTPKPSPEDRINRTICWGLSTSMKALVDGIRDGSIDPQAPGFRRTWAAFETMVDVLRAEGYIAPEGDLGAVADVLRFRPVSDLEPTC